MKIYKSKLDLWLLAVMVIALGGPIVGAILDKEFWLSLLFVAIAVVVAIMFYYTRYTLDGENLIIYRTKIPIRSIRKIYKTRNPISSPALSINRIAICYNKYDEVLISPKDREDFIAELLKVNPDITVNV